MLGNESELDLLGHAELRQGTARPDRPHRAPRGAVPLPTACGWGCADERRGRSRNVCERVLRLVGTDAEAEVTVTAGHGGAHPLRDELHPPERRRRRARWFTCAWRSTGAWPRPPPTRPMTTPSHASSAPPLDAARLQPVDPGWPGLAPPADGACRRPLGRCHGADAEPAQRAERVADFVARGGWPRDGRILLDRGGRHRLRQLGRPAARRSRDDALSSTGSREPGAPMARRGPRRPGSRISMERPPAPRRPGARATPPTPPTSSPAATRSSCRPSCVVERARLPGASTASTAAPSRRAARSRASARRSSTLPSRSPTTSPTRWRSASASTPRAHRSARHELVQ